MEVVVLILRNLPNSTRSCKVKNYWVIELVTVLLLLLLSHVKQGICSTLMSIFGISLVEKVPSSKQNESGDANYPSLFLSLKQQVPKSLGNSCATVSALWSLTWCHPRVNSLFLTKRSCRSMSKGLLLAGWLIFQQWIWWSDLLVKLSWRWRNARADFVIMLVALTTSKHMSRSVLLRMHWLYLSYFAGSFPVYCG